MSLLSVNQPQFASSTNTVPCSGGILKNQQQTS